MRGKETFLLMNFQRERSEKTKRNLILLPNWVIPLALMVLGSILRLIYIDSVPGGLHQDEAFVLLNAFDLYHEGADSSGNSLPVYLSSWGDGQSAMYSWLLVPLLIFNNGIPTVLLGRLPQAIIGILTLWCTYLVMRRLFGETAGCIALFALAICPWHIMMSRWALDANMAPGFLLFGFYFFARAMEDDRFLPLAALFYGLSLYCYAIVWLVLPVLLLVLVVYGICTKRIRANWKSALSFLILLALALPLMLFVLINQGLLPQLSFGPFTIPKTLGYRGGEVTFSPAQMVANLKTALWLLFYQDTGTAYEILRPWGFFYDLGRIFAVLGAILILIRVICSFLQKEFCWEFLLLAQLIGGGFNCLVVSAHLHQINSLFLPIVLCESYGMWKTLLFLKRKNLTFARIASIVTATVFLCCLVLFERDYFTEYATLTKAYYAEGVEDCVEYALAQCEETGLTTITAEKATQWPRLLLYTQTLPSQYFATVTYDVAPAPAAFTTTDGIRINTRLDYENISTDSIYILYYTGAESFSGDFTLTQFEDWYVAVPNE